MELNVTGDEGKTESARDQSLADFEANRITERRFFEDDPECLHQTGAGDQITPALIPGRLARTG
jgi:hypothetical protein